MKKILLCVGVLTLMIGRVCGQGVVTYPKDNYTSLSAIFKLKANAQNADVIAFNDYNYTHFAFTTQCTIEISINEPVKSYTVSPHSLNIKAVAGGNKLVFKLKQPQDGQTPNYLVVKINNLPDLLILADTPDKLQPLANASDIFNITKAPYLAGALGKTNATKAIQQAINNASAVKGTVYVPPGVFNITALQMQSNVKLHLAGGAVLRGIADSLAYPLIKGKRQYGALIQLNGADSIAIYGHGTLDANGVATGINTGIAQNRKVYRSVINGDMLKPSAGVKISGITCKDATEWTIRADNCRDVSIDQVKVINNKNWVWIDGIDMPNAQNVVIQRCFVYTGDDAFCVKALRGRQQGSSNITYKNSIVYSGRSAAVRVAAETYADISNVSFDNIDVISAPRGIVADIIEGGHAISNVTFSNIRVEYIGVNDPNKPMAGYYQPRPIHIECEKEGSISNLKLANIDIKAGNYADSWKVNGYNSNNRVNGITFNNVKINSTLIEPAKKQYPQVGSFASF